MSELKYSGLVVAVACGFIASLIFDNMYLMFAGVVAGILYEVIAK